VAYRPTPRTQAQKAERRDRIVSAALERVARGGYASAAIQSVAADAGVAVGTVYRHFGSKGELFAEVFRQVSQRELDTVVEVSGRDGRPVAERLAAAVETFCRRALARPVLAWALIAEPADPTVETERLRLRTGYRDAFASVLEDGVRDGELRPHDSRTVAAALVGALAESLVGPLSAANGRSHEALISTLVQFCEEALPRAHAPVHA
jgi:AcrR family transcriptional regulator